MKKLVALILVLSSLASVSNAQSNKPHPNLLRGPYLQVATSNSIVIRWRTDVFVKGVVHYGSTPDHLDKIATDSMQATEHKVKLTGLETRARYYYSIGSKLDTLQIGAGNYFVTLPTPGSTDLYRIAVVGDCGNNSINQRNVRDQLTRYIGQNSMDAWILLGDNCYTYGRDFEYQTNFFNIYKDTLLKRYPLFPSPGNHDYNDDQSAEDTHDIAYYQNFSMPTNGEAGGVASHNPAYYSFDIGNTHFLSLDSYGREDKKKMYDTTGAQAEWIKKDLAAYGHRGWVIAYWHHPPYTMGSHNSDSSDDLVQIRVDFIRILERYGVDLVLCGHSHDYERSKLIKDHYGLQASFNPAMNLVSTSSGLYDGSPNSCPYVKDSASGYSGTVYLVSGSAGQLGGKQKTYPHVALPYSDATHGGAGMLEIQDNRLDWKWICADGVIRDHFTMVKQAGQHHTITVKKGDTITLTASFTGDYHWTAGSAKKQLADTKSLTVQPSSTTVYTAKDGQNCLKDVWEVKVTR